MVLCGSEMFEFSVKNMKQAYNNDKRRILVNLLAF